MKSRNLTRLGLGFWAVAALVVVWSYTLVDKNLVLLPYAWSFQLQQAWWQWGDQRLWLAVSYVSLTLLWWGLWFIVQRKSDAHLSLRKGLKWFIPLVFLLVLGHNALSHDLFNYLFNAKMVTVYQVNPHVRVALDFTYDPWTRFMHNTHTPAPYGYGWTLISLVPVWLSGDRFLLAYLFMKLWMLLGLTWLLATVWWGLKQSRLPDKTVRLASLALLPLLLWETLMNGHNDVWMMAPALGAVLLARFGGQQKWYWVLLPLLWAFSVSIKLASVALLPIIVGLLLIRFGKTWLKRWPRLSQLAQWCQIHWAEGAALAMFLPLLTARSQWFHPWYLIWAFTFWPFIQWRWLRAFFLGLAVTSMWRYLPWMLNNLEYSPEILSRMRLITWSGGVLGLVWGLITVGRSWLDRQTNHL